MISNFLLSGKARQAQYLARMDGRKMKAQVKEKDGQVQVTFHPEIEPELRAYSEASVRESSDAMRYIPLKLWSESRFKRNEESYKQYQQYENDPQLVMTETKDILRKLQGGAEEDFTLFNSSIPAYACAVLLRDYFDMLSTEDRTFCKEVIIDFASLPLDSEGYRYQVTDGTEPAITILPELLKYFPEDNDEILISLFLLLLNPWREIATVATNGIIESLWEINPKSAHSLFLGYLLLKQNYDALRKEIQRENYQKGISGISESQVVNRFEEQYDQDLERIVSNGIVYEDLSSLEQHDLGTLQTAFELLPVKTEYEDHKKFLHALFTVFSRQLFQFDEKVEYTLQQRFLKKLAYFLLHSTKTDIITYLQPFLENFTNAEAMAAFFSEFISAEDRLNQYEAFWIVWDAFYEKIVEIAKKPGAYGHTNMIIRTYLLAQTIWKEGITEWHSLKEREKRFFEKVANDMGYSPTVLYSFAKVLNDIGSNYLDDGITWLSTILEKNENLFSEDLETNTIYHIEALMRRYASKHRQRLRSNVRVKKQVIVILTFLVERGSTTGLLIRVLKCA